MCVSDVITNVTKQNERHGVDTLCLTCKTLEKQEQKVSANQNNFDTIMFLTF